ncbi:uncharacterized protein LOC100902762 [Galendromus occidentalis]|uniref:Uncharacterized protein LOC100902762 n=1 Tax=Galendromus occidentalis TaxID=34638 RepID=A0AAJ6VV98_9ACAR|nr:uncharacterized protein LOC100902762 [Galendromus occidentalis]
MANHLRNSIPEKIDEIFLYSDNSAVLGWLRSSPEKWKPFVANRVKEILGYSSPDRWSYIQSEENPADLLSRGSALETDSLKQFWLEGPSWLRDNRSQRSHVLNAPSESEEMLREKKVEITAAVASRVQDESTFSSKFSSWAKLVRVTAFMRRWLPKNRNKFKSGDNSITPEEFMEAEIAVVKTIQRQHFAAELDAGASNLSKASALKTLNPFVDDSGILRCRSRLEKSSNINYEVKFPVILPGKDSLVQLLIRSIHETQCLHSGGTAGALHALRQRFLILSARREVNRAIHGCKVCARFKAKAAAEPMPPLPAFRIEESPPFAVTGVDHAGPIYIENAAGEKTKSYILLFVCAVTRALRLELVADLSTYEFLLALRRFMSRNPSVKHIISDNARTFLKAEKELKSLFEKAKHPDCQSLLSKKGMKWSHSTERAPWHGAFWERLVQVVKRPLRKILGIHALPFRETETLLFEIEKMVNDRPISAVVVDPDEPRALSPSCLLYGYASQPSLPDTKKVLAQSSEATSIVFSERWKRQQAALRSFWKQFQNEYLQHLRSLHYAKFQNSRPIKKGDVCILHSAEASRAFWPLCIVQEVFGGESTDSRRRSCLIKTSSGQILERPIQLLYPLEINEF